MDDLLLVKNVWCIWVIVYLILSILCVLYFGGWCCAGDCALTVWSTTIFFPLENDVFAALPPTTVVHHTHVFIRHIGIDVGKASPSFSSIDQHPTPFTSQTSSVVHEITTSRCVVQGTSTCCTRECKTQRASTLHPHHAATPPESAPGSGASTPLSRNSSVLQAELTDEQGKRVGDVLLEVRVVGGWATHPRRHLEHITPSHNVKPPYTGNWWCGAAEQCTPKPLHTCHCLRSHQGADMLLSLTLQYNCWQ